jgi:hypothetical protein
MCMPWQNVNEVLKPIFSLYSIRMNFQLILFFGINVIDKIIIIIRQLVAKPIKVLQ